MINCIVIGAGRIALSHLPHIIFHSKINLVSIIEPNKIASFLIKRLTNIPVVKDISQIDIDSYDSAFVLTPPISHFSISKELLKKGKNVFVEKPFTLNPVESQNLLDLAKGNNAKLSVGYVYRHHPIFHKLKEILANIDINKITSGQIKMEGNVVSPKMKKTWRNTGIGSGCIYDYGCHAIDLSLFLFGNPDSVICTEKIELYQNGVVDKFKAELIYNKNFDFHVNCNWADASRRKAGLEINITTSDEEIWTDGQVIKIKGNNDIYLTIKDINTDVSYYLRGEEFQNQLERFISKIENNISDYSAEEHATLCDKIIAELHECDV